MILSSHALRDDCLEDGLSVPHMTKAAEKEQ